MPPGARRGAILIGLALIAAASPARLAAQDTARAVRPRSAYDDLRLFSQVLNQIRINHPDSLDPHHLLMAAVEAMVRAADPHSYVLPAIRLSPERQEALRRGQLHPVPIEFTYLRGTPTVLSVRPGTETSRLDILPGDELVAVDGAPLRAESAAELDIVLAGKRGSGVALSLRRRRWDGSIVTVERHAVRERLEETPAVGTAFMLDRQTGYLRLLHFAGERVFDETRDSLRSLERRGMQRLVLDLRDNGGGLLEAASDLAGEFLPRRTIVYTSEGRRPADADTVYAKRSSSLYERHLAIVVLVNAGTASAAELVSGALQDHDRAIIAGQTTFGKSLMMRGFPLTDGSLMMLVVGHIKTPCGRVIQRPYRDVRFADYLRLAGSQADTAGRPSCRTARGRTVYGGGGIVPDAPLSTPEPAPLWLARLREEHVALRWAGSYAASPEGVALTLDGLATERLPEATMQDFLTFVSTTEVQLPSAAAEHPALRRLLASEVAQVRWGSRGLYTVLAMSDPEVGRAVELFDRAAQLLAP